MIYSTNDKRYYIKDTEDGERHQFILRMYFNAIFTYIENPFNIDDQSSKDDTLEDNDLKDNALKDDVSEDDALEDNII